MVVVWRCVETETPVIRASQTVFWNFCLIGTCICRYTNGVFHLVKQTGFSAKQLHYQFIWHGRPFARLCHRG